ncbi:hypothetical protein DACRYDRAFT_95903 [Dacryopinax primogenitus]|uniref:Uncharacterized protein n=1 Tax=Dacryopinax primogenitus (strain DJM 731) TaxID=1858805 RepID=M5FR36_DACPD|nr:uncharacterized protein DACRYDRAFT_95903 [Dacryopinax primogenitus]EJT99515.1 hypothetical protein DACRYDRAFT_95903 [Dacryopinax primogenitus]
MSLDECWSPVEHPKTLGGICGRQCRVSRRRSPSSTSRQLSRLWAIPCLSLLLIRSILWYARYRHAFWEAGPPALYRMNDDDGRFFACSHVIYANLMIHSPDPHHPYRFIIDELGIIPMTQYDALMYRRYEKGVCSQIFCVVFVCGSTRVLKVMENDSLWGRTIEESDSWKISLIGATSSDLRSDILGAE